MALISVLQISNNKGLSLQQPFLKGTETKLWYHGQNTLWTFSIKWPPAQNMKHIVCLFGWQLGGLSDDMEQCHMTLGMLWEGHYWIGTRVGSGLAWIRWGLIEGAYVASIATWHQPSHFVPCHHHKKKCTCALKKGLLNPLHLSLSISIYIDKNREGYWLIKKYENFVALVG